MVGRYTGEIKLQKDGQLFNGFDHDLQVWVKNGIVNECGHLNDACGCNQRMYEGMTIDRARIHHHTSQKQIILDHFRASLKKGDK